MILNLSKKGEKYIEVLEENKKKINEAILEKNDLYGQLIAKGELKKYENRSKYNNRAKSKFKW